MFYEVVCTAKSILALSFWPFFTVTILEKLTSLDLLSTFSCTEHAFHKLLLDSIITGITFGFPQDQSERIRECENQSDCAELGFGGICCGNIHATGST